MRVYILCHGISKSPVRCKIEEDHFKYSFVVGYSYLSVYGKAEKVGSNISHALENNRVSCPYGCVL